MRLSVSTVTAVMDTYASVVKIVEVDPATGVEDPDSVTYGVVAGHEDAYAVTRSARTLDDLAAEIDLTDKRALWEHAQDHHPYLGEYP